MNQIKEYAPPNVKIMIVGNKSDLKNDRIIDTEGGEESAKKFGVKFMETSAMSGENIKEIFDSIGRDIIKDFNPDGETGEKLGNFKSKKKKCCN